MTATTGPREVALADAVVFARAVLQAVGATPEHAEVTAQNLVFADQSGIGSHGLLRLPLYADAVRHGGINVDPSMRWLRQSPGGAVLDADGAFGQVAMTKALGFARAELRKSAAVVVAVQGSSHFGAGAYWVDQLAQEGLVGVVTSTTGPVVAPYGGAEKTLGTNPLSVGLPTAEGPPMILDMATSTGAYGKVVAARNAGESIPEGWAVDGSGNPTTDPEQALKGAMTPFGGHKGSGLAVVLEGLSAALSGASFAFETEDIWVNPASRMNLGHTVIAVNPGFFTGSEHVRTRFSDLRQRVRSAGESVVAPGDMEAACRGSGDTIALSPSTLELLDHAAERWNVQPLAAQH